MRLVKNICGKRLFFSQDKDIKEFTFNFFTLFFPNFAAKNSPTPSHPREALIRQCDSPKSISSFSSDNDIKQDTSLNITHVYEEIDPKSVNGLRSKVRQVLGSGKDSSQPISTLHGTKQRVEIVIPIDDDDESDQKEDIFKDQSEEEITDSGSDSDFVPSQSDSESESVHIIEESSSKKRLRKTPQRFSPVRLQQKDQNNKQQQKQKRLKIEQQRPTSAPPSKQATSTVKKQFTHDKCAAWDCVKPSGSIKQITWVACDDCDAWYHMSCSGLSAKDALKSDTKYHCGCM